MTQEPTYAVNWNHLNRINGRRRKQCRRGQSRGNCSHNFLQATAQEHNALVKVGQTLSRRYHGQGSSGTSIMTVYFSEPGAKNWSQNVRQNLFGAALTSNRKGDLYVLLDDLTAAIGEVRESEPTLSNALDAILTEAQKTKSHRFCKTYPLARDATEADCIKWLAPAGKKTASDSHAAP